MPGGSRLCGSEDLDSLARARIVLQLQEGVQWDRRGRFSHHQGVQLAIAGAGRMVPMLQ